jgi:Rhamnan synthesis protein F
MNILARFNQSLKQKWLGTAEEFWFRWQMRRGLAQEQTEILKSPLFGTQCRLENAALFQNAGLGQPSNVAGKGTLNSHLREEGFDEALYCDANPDVKASIQRGYFKSGLEHFLRRGRLEIICGIPERRLPFRLGETVLDFDQEAYLADNRDAGASVESGAFDSGLDHFLKEGFPAAQRGDRQIYRPDRFVELRAILAGGVSAGRGNACIFAHYDQQEIIDEYVVQYVKALSDQSIDIIFVTEINDRAELEKVRPYASKVFVKNGAGRDFGSWAMVLAYLGLSYFDHYEYLILANDSVYCLVSMVQPMFESMLSGKLNLWGITDSLQIGQYHLQSYFLAFDSAARSLILGEFISRFKGMPYLTKHGQITEYEAGFSRRALESNLKVGAYCSVRDVQRDLAADPELHKWHRKFGGLSLEQINPSHNLWDLMILRYGCPTLKVQLLRDNPLKVDNLSEWPQVVQGRGLDVDVIRRHLRRLASSSRAI